MTQATLADALCVPLRTYQAWECNDTRRIHPGLWKLARLLVAGQAAGEQSGEEAEGENRNDPHGDDVPDHAHAAGGVMPAGSAG